MLDESEILLRSDLQRLLKCSRTSIYHRVRDASLPSHKMGGKFVFYRSEIEAWLKKRPSTSPPTHT
jgi:excisionase family DNA binding protein